MTASESILRELRALPLDAPVALRERVRALGEPAPRWSFPTLPWRRSLLVLAPVCALGLVIAAVVHGLANSSERQLTAREKAVWRANPSGAGASGALDSGVPIVPPNPGRRQD